MTLLLVLAVAIGATLVILGAGGSILTVPLLMYGGGLDVHRAAATSLVIVGAVSLVATALQWGRVRVRTGLLVGLAGMVGTMPGVWLNHRLPDASVTVGFAIALLVAAARLGRRDGMVASVARGAVPTLAAGLGAGVATGLFGVGGGFVVVPVLVLLVGLPMGEAVATSLFVVTLNSAAGVLGHLAYGAVEWRLAAIVTIAALGGVAAARPVARAASGPRLQQAFAAGLVVVGLTMLASVVHEALA